MNALSRVFPSSMHLLCQWHIRRSIYTRTKAHFSPRRTSTGWRTGAAAADMDDSLNATKLKEFLQDWDDVVFAISVDTYREKWRDLQRRNRRGSALLDYLRDTLLPLKEHFMSSWVDKHLHLGATETSRLEGFHSGLKQLLGVSTFFLPLIWHELIRLLKAMNGNLNAVYRSVRDLVQQQSERYRVTIDQHRLTHLYYINTPLFAPLQRKVTNTVLRLLNNELELSRQPDFPTSCTCTTMTAMGFPCGHYLQQRVAAGESVPLSEIH